MIEALEPRTRHRRGDAPGPHAQFGQPDGEATAQVQRWLGALSAKWTVPILERLKCGPLRYNSLLALTEPVSAKVLTQTLRRLESEGLISRPFIEGKARSYRLTSDGHVLLEHAASLRRYADQYTTDTVSTLARSS